MKLVIDIVVMITWTTLVLLAMVLALVVPDYYFGEPGRIIGAFSIVVCLVIYVHWKEVKNHHEFRSKRKTG